MPRKFKLPASLKTVTIFSKSLALFLFVLLPFFGFSFGYQFYDINLDINRLCEPLVQAVKSAQPTRAPVYESPLLENISVDYDTRTFKVEKGNGHFANDLDLNYWSFYMPESSGPVLQIIDLSKVESPLASLGEVISGGFSDEGSSALRPVRLNGKVYEFKSQGFGEGSPTSDGCFSGGGFHDNYFVSADKLGFLIRTTFSETGCGQKVDRHFSPDKHSLEKVLKIIESIKF